MLDLEKYWRTDKVRHSVDLSAAAGQSRIVPVLVLLKLCFARTFRKIRLHLHRNLRLKELQRNETPASNTSDLNGLEIAQMCALFEIAFGTSPHYVHLAISAG